MAEQRGDGGEGDLSGDDSGGGLRGVAEEAGEAAALRLRGVIRRGVLGRGILGLTVLLLGVLRKWRGHGSGSGRGRRRGGLVAAGAIAASGGAGGRGTGRFRILRQKALRGLLLLQVFQLLLRLIQRHFLDENGLREDVEGIRPGADAAANQFIGIAIDRRGRSVSDTARELFYELTFLVGHRGGFLFPFNMPLREASTVRSNACFLSANYFIL